MVSKQSRGLAVSVIQADKKPAVIFLDNQGNYLSKSVGVNNAVAATLVNGAYGSTVLVYIDDNGMLLWNVF